MPQDTHDLVQDYYGKVLQSSADLQTNACCTADAVPDWLKPILAKIHPDVLSRYYGCGLIAPQALRGAHVLDLGCGTGRDVYALSALVGAEGHVVGVDMTAAQLDTARATQAFHTAAFGLPRPNTSFQTGLIEDLGALDISPGSLDVVVSNCVVNLARDKGAVLRGVFDLLKPGGEMYFSDVYADRRIPAALASDPVLYGECLSGALYWHDFLNLARATGFADPRIVTTRKLVVENDALATKLGGIGFTSTTVRLFKLPTLEPGSEDYGQSVLYKGTAENHPSRFELDAETVFPTGQQVRVCGNTYRILSESRFAAHFEF